MNSCTFLGNVVRKPELETVGDTVVTKFSIAVNNKFKGKDGNVREEVDFFDMVAWDKGAETICKFFEKGMPILVQCRAKHETWTDRESGKNRSKVTFRIERFHFVGGKKSNNGESTPEVNAAIDVGGTTVPVTEDEIPF